MSSLEKEFAAFEEAIIRVGREYDVFLYGTNGRLPADGKRRLQEMARALSGQKIDSPGDRYRLNTVLGRFNSQVEHWERAVRDKEEGRGRFARAAAGPSANARPSSSVHGGAALARRGLVRPFRRSAPEQRPGRVEGHLRQVP